MIIWLGTVVGTGLPSNSETSYFGPGVNLDSLADTLEQWWRMYTGIPL
jgi:hypothetical protein